MSHFRVLPLGDFGGRLFYYAVKPLVKAIFFPICRREIKGKCNSLPKGPIIVVSNHLSNFDIPIIGITLPRRAIFMGKEQLFRFPLGLLFRLLGGFAVRRGRVDREALNKANDVLDKGLALVMFPEGERSRSYQLKEPRPGTALLALRSDVCIIPIGITGSERIGPEKTRIPFGLFHRPLVTIHIGEPFKLSFNGEKPSRAELAHHTDLVMRRVAELLPASYRGVYQEVASGNRKS